MVHISVLLMVKDEEQRLPFTLKSLEGKIDSVVFFDTGSTDKTVEIAKEWSLKSKIPIHLKEGKFTNFSDSRNEMIDFADTIPNIDFYIFLDSNDELRDAEKLRSALEAELSTETTGFFLPIELYSGGVVTRFFNVRATKSRSGWRYKGSVHEFIANPNEKISAKKIDKCVTIYQDRLADISKSQKRYHRDKILLQKEYKTNKTPRCVFYLAQTFECLGEFDNAIRYYEERSTMEGFQEEKYEAYYRAGVLYHQHKKNHLEAIKNFMASLMVYPKRAEPACQLADIYQIHKNFDMSYLFAKYAVDVPYPEDAILFVDKKTYDYTRWHLMGIVAYYVEQYDEGIRACVTALKTGLNPALDGQNMQFYVKKMKELKNN